MVGFFVGRVYQLDKPETFNYYPLDWSGYYGLERDCIPNYDVIGAETLILLNVYRIDDVTCNIVGSKQENGWYTLKPHPTCSRDITPDDAPNYEYLYENVQSASISVKAEEDNRLWVRYANRPETLYYRCSG